MIFYTMEQNYILWFSLVEIAKVLELDFVGTSYILVLNVKTFLLYVWDFFFFMGIWNSQNW